MNNGIQKMATIFEPYRIKTVEPIHITTKEDRQRYLQDAGFNPFLLRANQVTIDLLSDSGTGKADIAISKVFFDTTRAHVENNDVKAIDINDADGSAGFKGNIGCIKLEKMLSNDDQKVVIVVTTTMPITITNNVRGGCPVSLANIRQAALICRKYRVPFYADACRFAENAWFIKTREEGYGDKTPAEIALEMFTEFDVCTSAKKDAIANMGGFLATRDKDLFEKCSQKCILNEGFINYGGLSGRDLEAIAIGLTEGLDERYLKHRIETIQEFGRMLEARGVFILEPGGHAVFVDAEKTLSHLSRHEYPGWTLACALYVEGGIRAGEIGNIMSGYRDKHGKEVFLERNLVRLAVPRRVYTLSHLKYVADVFGKIVERKNYIKGMAILKSSSVLRHFTIIMKPLEEKDCERKQQLQEDGCNI
ncbi:hypothetical protein CHS0354_016046 [Potamilus streckersoni]|uniref:Aromatic amino acid beta-eliminating lyase/threonine aldolase domain-containing protein n=1 Tax=Potamilus streckersoni TaxID=2493646 RepID=A0AAE0T1X4_9BIVA|nr:hypothetical protein CHS0354_016046 [Potamilus streckersoni]